MELSCTHGYDGDVVLPRIGLRIGVARMYLYVFNTILVSHANVDVVRSRDYRHVAARVVNVVDAVGRCQDVPRIEYGTTAHVLIEKAERDLVWEFVVVRDVSTHNRARRFSIDTWIKRDNVL